MRATLTDRDCTYEGDTTPSTESFAIELENRTLRFASFGLVTLFEGESVEDIDPVAERMSSRQLARSRAGSDVPPPFGRWIVGAEVEPSASTVLPVDAPVGRYVVAVLRPLQRRRTTGLRRDPTSRALLRGRAAESHREACLSRRERLKQPPTSNACRRLPHVLGSPAVRFAIPLVAALAMLTFVACSGDDNEAATPVPLEQRFLTAEDAPDSKADPDETRQTTVDFDEFIATLSERAIDPDTEESDRRSFRRLASRARASTHASTERHTHPASRHMSSARSSSSSRKTGRQVRSIGSKRTRGSHAP